MFKRATKMLPQETSIFQKMIIAAGMILPGVLGGVVYHSLISNVAVASLSGAQLIAAGMLGTAVVSGFWGVVYAGCKLVNHYASKAEEGRLAEKARLEKETKLAEEAQALALEDLYKEDLALEEVQNLALEQEAERKAADEEAQRLEELNILREEENLNRAKEPKQPEPVVFCGGAVNEVELELPEQPEPELEQPEPELEQPEPVIFRRPRGRAVVVPTAASFRTPRERKPTDRFGFSK